jgi:hypothetical protein
LGDQRKESAIMLEVVQDINEKTEECGVVAV